MPLIARRKLAFILACCGVVLQTVIQVNNVEVFFVCRSLQGVVTGLFLILVPVYVREISPK
jgi:MFS family permease